MDPVDLGAAMAREARARGGLLVATDFDGTLAPIGLDPDAVRPVPGAAAPLAWLSREGASAGGDAAVPVRLAIITSRDAGDVAHRLLLGPEATVVGCAGLEVMTNGEAALDPAVAPSMESLAEATERLAAALSGGRIPGARLERKRCGVVVHSRGLPDAVDAEILGLARSVADPLGLRVVLGKRAVEVRPAVDVDKADAVASLRTGPWTEAALVTAGDDLPDVAMLDLAASTPGGTGVAVADTETPPAVLDVATATVEGPWGWAAALAEAVRRLSGATGAGAR